MSDIWKGTGPWEGWRLTKGHASSSYGQIVLVSPDGTAYGPDNIISLTDVMSVPEAATKWSNATEPTLKRYLSENRFGSNEARKSKGNWRVTRQGMNRLFGISTQ